MRGQDVMILTKEKQGVIAGIDFRKEIPQVCYQTGDRKEPAYLPLEYEKLSGHTACFCKILSALKRFEKKENIRFYRLKSSYFLIFAFKVKSY